MPVSWEEVNTCWETIGAVFKLLFYCSHHVAAPDPCWCKVSKAGFDQCRLLLFAWRIRDIRGTTALSLLQHDAGWWDKARFLAQHCSSPWCCISQLECTLPIFCFKMRNPVQVCSTPPDPSAGGWTSLRNAGSISGSPSRCAHMQRLNPNMKIELVFKIFIQGSKENGNRVSLWFSCKAEPLESYFKDFLLHSYSKYLLSIFTVCFCCCVQCFLSSCLFLSGDFKHLILFWLLISQIEVCISAMSEEQYTTSPVNSKKSL